jgi:hypothetical protein
MNNLPNNGNNFNFNSFKEDNDSKKKKFINKDTSNIVNNNIPTVPAAVAENDNNDIPTVALNDNNDNNNNDDNKNDIPKAAVLINDIKNEKNDTEKNSLYNNDDDFLILSNLTLLSKVQKYDKLIIIKNENEAIKSKIDFEIKIDNSYVRCVSRYIYGYGRAITIDFINKIIDIAIQQYIEEKHKLNKINMNKYVSLLESCKFGLSNLKFTYNDDITITSNIDIIIDKIDIFRINTHCV